MLEAPALKLVFAGTPEFSATHLQALIDNQLAPQLVLTQPDRQSGRGRKLTASPVKEIATTHQIPLYQPLKFDNEAKTFLLNQAQPDLLIVVAYGLLLPQWVLDWAKYGAINVHASLLPRWRGAAPIQRAIEAGDTQSGIGIMQMDIGLDTGDVWHETTLPINTSTTAEQLHDAMQIAGAKALIETLPRILSGTQHPTPQSKEGITYAKKLSKEEGKINWQESAETITRKIRAFNPTPVAHTQSGKKRYRIYNAYPVNNTSPAPAGTIIGEGKKGIAVKCGQGSIVITELQEVGKKRLSANEYSNGNSLLNHLFV